MDRNWQPGFGTIYTWFAMDRYGRLAVMVNNCFGDLPQALLAAVCVDVLLDNMSEFLWEESSLVSVYPEKKRGNAKVDLFSAWRYRGYSIDDVLTELKKSLIVSGVFSEFNLSVNKGLYVYHGVEGDNPGIDYPVGYSGESEMGDYFRFIVPTQFAVIDDFPSFLRKAIVVSDTVDFASDRLLKSSEISELFSVMLE